MPPRGAGRAPPVVSTLLLASLLGAGPAARAGSPPVERPADAGWRAALDLVYDGAFAAAEARLQDLARENPDDPFGPYLQALALCWRIEQRPETGALDGDFERHLVRAAALANAALARDPRDGRARLALGATHAVRSRHQMLRGRRKEAAREAVRMREDLLAARALGATVKEVSFGLGLYDYYVDVLPRLVKLLRFLIGMPGGDRARGLALIGEAREGCLFHGTEVRVQLYEIDAFYEGRPTRALAQMRALRRRYPGWPVWGLKLAEHLRDRLGLYAEGAAAAREVLETAERGAHPNYQPVVAAMARLSLGESLLLDLRLADARRTLVPALGGSPQAPALAGRARLLLGRVLQLEGDREAALAHLRLAGGSPDPGVRRGARDAASSPVPPDELRALRALALARRHREALEEAQALAAGERAFAAWPKSEEARLLAAEAAFRDGGLERARDLLDRLPSQEQTDPPFVGPRARLLLAELEERRGDRGRAVKVYKEVFKEPFARDSLRERAAAGLRRAGIDPDRLPAGERALDYSK